MRPEHGQHVDIGGIIHVVLQLGHLMQDDSEREWFLLGCRTGAFTTFEATGGKPTRAKWPTCLWCVCWA